MCSGQVAAREAAGNELCQCTITDLQQAPQMQQTKSAGAVYPWLAAAY